MPNKRDQWRGLSLVHVRAESPIALRVSRVGKNVGDSRVAPASSPWPFRGKIPLPPCGDRPTWVEFFQRENEGAIPESNRGESLVKLTAKDICSATGGELTSGRADTVFTSVTIDSRTATQGALFVPLPGTRTDGHAHLDAAVQQGAAGFLFSRQADSSPSVGATSIAVQDSLMALQDLSAWHRNRLSATIVGIAGSNGKTTTKELLAQVCAAKKRSLATLGNLNNHIGLPLSLLRAEGDEEILVLEMGTSGPGELALLSRLARPHIGVITSIAEEHTEMLTDLSGVIEAETELIAALPEDGLAIVDGDDAALLEAVERRARCRVITFGEKASNTFRAAEVRVSREGTQFTLHAPIGTRSVQLGLLGSHFALAALVSIAVATECGIGLDDACAALRTARGAPRRMAVIDFPERRLTILDDCYNANPASMQQALITAKQVRMTAERLILVLGDMRELGSVSVQRHQEMGVFIASLSPQPDLLITVGDAARDIATYAQKSGISVQTCQTAEEAAALVQETIHNFDGQQLVLIKGSRGVRLEVVTQSVSRG